MEPHRGGQRCLRPGPRQVYGYAHEYAQDFHDAVHAYEDLAYKYGLWSAVRLMGHATDDGFTDFRAWLISQGKEAYFAALKELAGEAAFDNMSETTGEMIEETLKADIHLWN